MDLQNCKNLHFAIGLDNNSYLQYNGMFQTTGYSSNIYGLLFGAMHASTRPVNRVFDRKLHYNFMNLTVFGDLMINTDPTYAFKVL